MNTQIEQTRHRGRTRTVVVGALLVLAGLVGREASAQTCTPLTAGAISGIVFLDSSGDGLRQAEEQGVNGVGIRVTGPTGSVVTVTSGGVAAIPGQYTTGPSLCDEGTYAVEITSVPVGYVVPGPASQLVTLTRNPANGILSKENKLNFPLQLAPCTSTIGDFVWHDLNANGVQDAGEPGIPGVTVNLLNASGTLIQTTTTSASGLYQFTVPCSQNYYVQVVPPANFVASPTLQGGDAALDSNPSPTLVTVGVNENITDIDFGFYAACQAAIGDFVWHDLNRNGVQDAGEPGLFGVQVQALQGSTVVATAFTNAAGAYSLPNLCPGTYTVSYDPATVPTGFLPTITGAGTTDTDSNPNASTVTLTDYNSTDLTIDFGFQVPCAGIIGDFVWNDLNRNGVQDAGEPGLAGVEVRLYMDGQSSPAQVVITNANGYYQFTGLCGGTYLVEVNPNALPAGAPWLQSPANQGGDDAVDSDGVDHRAGVTLPGDNASDLTIDFGYYRKQGLSATKSAVGSYDRRFGWTLDKSVSPTSHSGTPGQTAGTSTWTVTTTKSETLSNYRVTGSIVVSNPNPFATTFAVTDQLNDGTVATVSCPSSTVAANSSVTCTYSASPAGATATLNTATITSDDVAGTTATAAVSFTATVIGDNTTTLADPRFSYSQAISTGGTVTFPETFTCPADPSKYTNGTHTFTVTNTATLTGPNTNLADDATVTVTCKQQFSAESATGYGTRYPGTSNWFMYTPYTTAKVNLVSGRDLKDARDIFMTRTGSGATARTHITIVLHTGWSWGNVGDVLKIQPFTTAPTTYLQPGAFLYKFTAPNLASYPGTSVVFSGNQVTVSLPGHAPNFYGIHADVLRALP